MCAFKTQLLESDLDSKSNRTMWVVPLGEAPQEIPRNSRFWAALCALYFSNHNQTKILPTTLCRGWNLHLQGLFCAFVQSCCWNATHWPIKPISKNIQKQCLRTFLRGNKNDHSKANEIPSHCRSTGGAAITCHNLVWNHHEMFCNVPTIPSTKVWKSLLLNMPSSLVSRLMPFGKRPGRLWKALYVYVLQVPSSDLRNQVGQVNLTTVAPVTYLISRWNPSNALKATTLNQVLPSTVLWLSQSALTSMEQPLWRPLCRYSWSLLTRRVTWETFALIRNMQSLTSLYFSSLDLPVIPMISQIRSFVSAMEQPRNWSQKTVDSSPSRWILQKMNILQSIQGLGLSMNRAYLKMWKYRIARTDCVTAKETLTRSQTSRAELSIRTNPSWSKNMNTYEYPGNSMVLCILHGQFF